MATPPKFRLVKFTDGVYLHGTVVQSIGVLDLDEDAGAGRSLMGLAKVSKIEANPVGLTIEMRGKYFLVPWHMVASCEIDKPVATPVGAADLLGDEEALERATRPAGKAAR